jgi:hypothetical protein
MTFFIPLLRPIIGPSVKVVIVWVVLLTWPTMVSAEPPTFETYLQQARQAIDAQEYDKAAEAARKGLALKEDYRLRCNLASATEQLGQRVTALNAWRTCGKLAARMAQDEGAARAQAFANIHAKDIEKTLRRTRRETRIESTPNRATFYINRHKEPFRTPSVHWLHFDEHQLLFVADPSGRFPENQTTVTIVAGPLRTVRVDLMPPTIGGGTSRKAKLNSADRAGVAATATSAGVDPWPWVIAAVGAGSLGGSAYFYVEGETLQKTEDGKNPKEHSSLKAGYYTTLALGGVLLATGLTWGLWDLLADPSSEEGQARAEPGWRMSPILGEVNGLHVFTRF